MKLQPLTVTIDNEEYTIAIDRGVRIDDDYISKTINEYATKMIRAYYGGYIEDEGYWRVVRTGDMLVHISLSIEDGPCSPEIQVTVARVTHAAHFGSRWLGLTQSY